MITKILVVVLIFLAAGCAHAQAYIDEIESLESPGSLRIFFPRKNELGYRGSAEERLRNLYEAPGMEVRVFDIQKVLDFIHAESKRKSCGGYGREISDALVIREAHGEIIKKFSVHENIAIDMESGECFSLPSFFKKLQGI